MSIHSPGHDAVLAEIARVAGSSLELDEVLDRIVDRAAALTGADRTSIWLLDRSGRRLLPSALYGMDEPFTRDWKTRPLALEDERLSRDVIETGQPLAIEDAAADPRTDKRSVEFFGDRSILVVPLVRRGAVVGTLFMNHVRRAYRFTAEDVATAQAIAGQAAIAIDNAQLYGFASRLAVQLHRSFRHAGEALASGADLRRHLDLMVQLAVETVGADGGSLELLDEDGRSTYAVATVGDTAPLGEAYRERFELRGDMGGTLGVLELWSVSAPFEDAERELLHAFAGHARAAIEHARLYASLQAERERARAAERREAEFSSMVSHELRTPLALVRGYAATLLRPPSPLPQERARRFVEGIEAAALRLQRLIDNLLSVSRLEGEMFVLQPEPVEVGPLIRRAVSASALIAGERRQIDVELPPARLWLLGDPDQLAQVLENLVGNALKYSPPESTVAVSARMEGDCVRISVRDHGPGIPAAARERVF
ncbi:MAG TPA: GAF domain-containing protein, partial [Chloroflexota bacterium]|nr:GAF domain-containing protein [Chloroflexota bacterium]